MSAPPATPEPVDLAALDGLVRDLAAEGDAGRRAVELLGIPLMRSRGALQVTGEVAPDDRVREATLAARVGAAAAVLVTTACGDVWIVGVHLEGGRWTTARRVPIIDDARPGACRLTRASASSCAMTSSAQSEVVVTFASASEEGDESRDPMLRVFHLEPDGALTALGGDLGFGGTDDMTGAVREGQWVVDEAMLLPRDLYVQVQPGRPGPGGAAPPFVVRRTYRIQSGRLVLLEETSSRLLPRLPPASPPPRAE